MFWFEIVRRGGCKEISVRAEAPWVEAEEVEVRSNPYFRNGHQMLIYACVIVITILSSLPTMELKKSIYFLLSSFISDMNFRHLRIRIWQFKARCSDIAVALIDSSSLSRCYLFVCWSIPFEGGRAFCEVFVFCF